MPRRPSSEITPDFPGAACPVDSIIIFTGGGGSELRGQVLRLHRQRVDAAGEDSVEYVVPYSAIISVEQTPPVECSLRDSQALAARLLAKHQTSGELAADWTFGFDLSTSRAAVCRYDARRIELSVSFSLRASRPEIEDAVLHEIAHAIVGVQHNHDAVWIAKARQLGCTAQRCHDVEHSVPRWVGRCACDAKWFRQRLNRKLTRNRLCARCRNNIRWRRNIPPCPPRTPQPT